MQIFAGFFMFLLVLGGLGLIGLVIYLFYYLAKKRREAIMAVADQLGLSYLARSDSSKDDIYSNISLFREGHSRCAYNNIGGTKEGFYVDIFDYKYVTGSGKHQTTHTRSVCVLAVPQIFSYLFIRTENFLDKIAGAIGFDDIDFESVEFSKRFYVKSDDKKFAYDIVHPGMMDFLLNYNNTYKTPSIEINGKYMVFYHSGHIKPERYIELYNFASDFYKKIPNYVLEELKTNN
jgi:hypothetical protein